ncbi:MAG TPA: pyridoxal phosphate-dependent aminotransferase [Sedimentibacter sp.]|nr:pyridoxal phosphate-dependent aminotransferase [Sedimentibacter sp.]HQO95112.1 pyridoxal phosphate-dependent aminotransferase [Sedimentibacter sp.]
MKHKFIAKRYWNTKSSAMGEIGPLMSKYNDVIDLTFGDPDFTTDEIIIKEAFKDALNGHTHYTSFYGDDELRDEICKYYHDEFNIKVERNETFISTSAAQGLWLALETITDDGDEIIIHEPYFTPYPDQIKLTRGIPVFLETFEEEGFQINVERLEKLITNRTKAIIINSPNNPSGARFSDETLLKIADIAEKYDLIVIVDDIYGLYTFDSENRHTPFMSIKNMKERTITICSASKDYAMTGWRIGYLIAPDYLVDAMEKVNENNVFTAPSVSQRAMLHAIRNRKIIQPKLFNIFKERVFYTYDRICQTKNMSVLPPRGTFYLFPNIKKTGLSSQEVSMKILDEAHVLTIPGSGFGSSGEGYIRIACTVGIDKLGEAFDRINKMDIFR